MSRFSRRAFAGLTLAAFVAGCSAVENVKEALPKQNTEDGAARIDARVDATLERMYLEYPETVQLSARASGMLIMPLITKAGFGFGGGYGKGALRIDNVTQEYYSASLAMTGLQIGAQQYAYVLFFMTDDALANFRNSQGVEVGGNIDFTGGRQGETLRANTTTMLSEVVPMVFGQAGIRVGVTLEGTKYTRISP
ncbi:MAG: YSC84-related protein [Paracoccaceae bacterium]|jgi:lipid-binding SYLF domain-containing protein|nr:twin-arginine translocation pathway signal [Paracoccaceae bacterium]